MLASPSAYFSWHLHVVQMEILYRWAAWLLASLSWLGMGEGPWRGASVIAIPSRMRQGPRPKLPQGRRKGIRIIMGKEDEEERNDRITKALYYNADSGASAETKGM
jgi:hypothetical protein